MTKNLNEFACRGNGLKQMYELTLFFVYEALECQLSHENGFKAGQMNAAPDFKQISSGFARNSQKFNYF